MTAPRIAVIVLAAGASSRLPGNKLIQPLEGKPVVRHVVEAAVASRAAPVIVVSGSAAENIHAALAGLPIQLINNPDYASGLSSSLKCGVREVPADCDAVIVALGDMPFVSAQIIDSLYNAFAPETGREICVPVHRGRRGNPVLWGRRFFAEILSLTGDQGAKQLMQLHGDLVIEVEAASDAVLIDIDVADDLKRRPT